MRQQLEVGDRELALNQSIERLEDVKRKVADISQILAEVKLEEVAITDYIIKELNVKHEGQKTELHGKWKLTFKRPFRWSINKKMLEDNIHYLDCVGEAVTRKEEIKYVVSPKKIDGALKSLLEKCNDEERDTVLNIFEKKSGSQTIDIGYTL